MAELNFRANGKLLLTGEYAVLQGAVSLALPCKLGQTLTVVQNNNDNLLHYQAFLHNGNPWFNATIQPNPIKLLETDSPVQGDLLCRALKVSVDLNPFAINYLPGKLVTTRLEFNKDFGLGSSSTWVSLLAKWLKVDAYALNHATFKGSGYDIACADSNFPILYQLIDQVPVVKPGAFPLQFHPSLYWIWLNKKAISINEIKKTRYQNFSDQTQQNISSISERITETNDLEELKVLLVKHEDILVEALNYSPIRQCFPDFPGVLKSLGAWGGDFILAIPDKPSFDVVQFFHALSFTTVLRSQDLFYPGQKVSDVIF